MLILAALGCIILGLLVLSRDRHSLMNILAASINGCVAIWSLAILIFLNTPSASAALVSAKIYYIASALFVAILTIFAALTAAPAEAQTFGGNYPVCIQQFRWGGSDIECSYTSLAQCNATASGLSAMCLMNPYYAHAQAPAGPRNRRQSAAY